jgi:HEAT repeat protein
MGKKLAALFKLQPGEGRPVSLILSLYFFMGVAFVLSDTTAYALFLGAFGAENLPYVYLEIALVVSLIAFIYLRLEKRLPLSRVLSLNLYFWIATSLLLWFGVSIINAAWLAFILPAWGFALINLCNIIVWTVAGRLFDIRQSKRLFGLVVSGRWIATAAGGFVTPPIVALLGTRHLMLVGALSLAAALLVLRAILRRYGGALVEEAPTKSVEATSAASESLLKNSFVLLIFGLTLMWVLTYIFALNIFYDRAGAQFPNADQLATFLGAFSAVSGLAAAFSTLFLTGRIISRFGLRGGLLTVPSLQLMTFTALALVGTFGGPAGILFGLAAWGRLVDTALSLTLDVATFRVLYQPLPPVQRSRAIAISEGMIEPLGFGIAGVVLLFITRVFMLNFVRQAYLVVAVVLVWLVLALLINRRYPAMLSRTITHRRLGETTINLIDRSSISVLQDGLKSPYPEAVIYSLNLLEQMEYEGFPAFLIELLEHPTPAVRRDALRRIERLKLAASLPAVTKRLHLESDVTVREYVLRALAASADSDALEQVSVYLHDPVIPIRRGALVGLVRSVKLDSFIAAGLELVTLLNSRSAAERMLAAQILGEVGVNRFYKPVALLLHDRNLEVRRAALAATGRIKHPALWPLVTRALAQPETYGVALQALIAGRESALPAVRMAFEEASQRSTVFVGLVRVCGRVGGQAAVELLTANMDTPQEDVRTQVLAALSACNYRAPDPAPIYARIKQAVNDAVHVLAVTADIGQSEATDLLTHALESRFARCCQRIFWLLSFEHESRRILRARDALLYSSVTQRAYALEVIDHALPQDIKGDVLALLDDLTPAERLARLKSSFPQEHHSREARLLDLLRADQPAWLRACALYAAGTLRLTDCRDAIHAAHDAPEPLVRETAEWALTQVDGVSGDQTSKLSTIQKVMILKRVNIFSATPDDVLADIAALLQESATAPGETIIREAEPGDSMYLIAAGKVRVHNGDQTLNMLGDSDVFGEMAFLDPQPRMASVTAVEPTQLFRLEQEPFFQLITERGEVARGIVRVLAGHLRARVRDLADLNQRVEQLATKDS